MASLLDEFGTLLSCPRCHATDWQSSGDTASGSLHCVSCSARYACVDGVLDLGDEDEDRRVTLERTAVRHAERDASLGGIAHDFDDLSRATGTLREAILALPHGDAGALYRAPGYFRNVSASAPAFDDLVARLGLTPGKRVLDVGADLTWATCSLARRGLDCTALDINHHLAVARVFREHFGVWYRAVRADMTHVTFREGVFDAVVAINALHHSGRLDALAGNLARMLVPGGRLGFIEPYCATPAEKVAFGRAQVDAGISEHTYLLDEWHQAFAAAGLVVEYVRVAEAFCAVYTKPEACSGAVTSAAARQGGLFARFYECRLGLDLDGPVTAAPGETLLVPLTIENLGNATWCANSRFPVYASYHLYRGGHARAESLMAFDNPRAVLPRELPPGGVAAVTLAVTAPVAPGEYLAEIDLVHEDMVWFAERGLAAPRLRFRVA